MGNAFVFDDVSKNFGKATALDHVSLTVPEQTIVGLIGRNGCGKTTLLNHVTGLQLPTFGQCTTLGAPAESLGPQQLSRIGAVWQDARFLEWMTVGRHIDYVASFYETWDREREANLVRQLELDPKAKIANLSPGNVQKLALVLAVCHHPALLLLDEPMSALDPITREQVLAFLLELLHEDGATTVISSHVLRDIESIVAHIVCLDRGRVVADAPLDDLQERYSEWQVTSTRPIPPGFAEPFVVSQRNNDFRAVLVVRDAGEQVREFESKHGVDVQSRPVESRADLSAVASGATMTFTVRTATLLDGLLLRPAVPVWVVASAFVAMALATFVSVFAGPGVYRLDARLAFAVWVFVALTGVLAGQAIREAQHCQFSWMLPESRRRMMLGTAVLGVLVSLVATNPIAAADQSFIESTLALAHLLPGWFTLLAVSLTCFWIGVSPSVLNILFVLTPLLLLSPFVVWNAPALSGAAMLVAPLMIGLQVYRTFRREAVRRRPFLPTTPLVGGAWAHGSDPDEGPVMRELNRPVFAGVWRRDHVGSSIRDWLAAAWHENHGWSVRGSAGVLAGLAVLAMVYPWCSHCGLDAAVSGPLATERLRRRHADSEQRTVLHCRHRHRDVRHRRRNHLLRRLLRVDVVDRVQFVSDQSRHESGRRVLGVSAGDRAPQQRCRRPVAGVLECVVTDPAYRFRCISLVARFCGRAVRLDSGVRRLHGDRCDSGTRRPIRPAAVVDDAEGADLGAAIAGVFPARCGWQRPSRCSRPCRSCTASQASR